MAEEHGPVALADPHASVAKGHVPAPVVHRSTRARAEEIDQELLLALDTVDPTMGPEAAELRIGLKPRQQIVRHRSDRVVPAESLVERLFRVAHRVLLKSQGRAERAHPTAEYARRPTGSPGGSRRSRGGCNVVPSWIDGPFSAPWPRPFSRRRASATPRWPGRFAVSGSSASRPTGKVPMLPCRAR